MFKPPGLFKADILFIIFIPRDTIVAGYYGFTLDVRVCPSAVRPSVFRFRMITWVNVNGFSPNLGMCIVGIANGQILTGVICPRHAHIFVSGG